MFMEMRLDVPTPAQFLFSMQRALGNPRWILCVGVGIVGSLGIISFFDAWSARAGAIGVLIVLILILVATGLVLFFPLLALIQRFAS